MTQERARLAAHKRHHPNEDDTALRRNLRAARAEEYIQRLVEEAPPLTQDQRARIAALLTAGAAA